MTRRMLTACALSCALSWTLPLATAQAQQTTATEDAHKAGHEVKKAGKAAGGAVKDGAKATAKGTKHVAKKTAHGARKVGEKTKDAVKPASVQATCNDGTTQTGRSTELACEDHGGARP